MSSPAIDLRVDFNAEDETGFPWTYLDEGAGRSRIVPGRYVIAGAGDAVAVVEVMDVQRRLGPCSTRSRNRRVGRQHGRR